MWVVVRKGSNVIPVGSDVSYKNMWIFRLLSLLVIFLALQMNGWVEVAGGRHVGY